jgi:valyl-tRNA synthetase
MGWTVRLIEGVRSLRTEMNVPAGARIALALTGAEAGAAERLMRNAALIERLARLEGVSVAGDPPPGSVSFAMEDCTVNLPLAEVIDLDAERKRLAGAIDKLGKEIGGLEKKLGNAQFLAKAPGEVVEEQRERLAAAEAERARLEAARTRIEGIG